MRRGVELDPRQVRYLPNGTSQDQGIIGWWSVCRCGPFEKTAPEGKRQSTFPEPAKCMEDAPHSVGRSAGGGRRGERAALLVVSVKRRLPAPLASHRIFQLVLEFGLGKVGVSLESMSRSTLVRMAVNLRSLASR